MTIGDEKLSRMIPVYPRACSAMLLAVKAGFVRQPYTEAHMRKGLSDLERRMAWLTLRDGRISESRAMIQRTTMERLSALGVEGLREGEEISYFSLLPEDYLKEQAEKARSGKEGKR